MSNIGHYSKAIVGAATAAASAAIPILRPELPRWADALTIVVAALGALGLVYVVPNAPHSTSDSTGGAVSASDTETSTPDPEPVPTPARALPDTSDAGAVDPATVGVVDPATVPSDRAMVGTAADDVAAGPGTIGVGGLSPADPADAKPLTYADTSRVGA